MTVIATAGHVDHGKSSLVRALTGTDPDRWAEEKERGLTIDLGFANLTLPNGDELSFIDVPGHIRFLRNMLAGVGGVQGTMFAVSATEGWKPQSEEHLRILDLLGVERAVIALTMADLVDEELLELAILDVEDHVSATFADGAPIVPVSAVDGTGLDRLRLELSTLTTDLGPPHDRNRPRLWIDRAFAPTGAGSVVTGTLTDGSVALGDRLVVHPGREVRIRGLQTHNRTVESLEPGHRVALNLSGISHHDLARGDVLVGPDQWHASSIIDARLSVLPGLDRPITRRGSFLTYIGSAEIPVRIRPLGSDDHIEPGGSGAVRLYLSRAVPALPGDRFILRESGRNETVGGGTFLEVDPRRRASVAAPSSDPDRIVADRGWVSAEEFTLLSGVDATPTIGRWLVDDAALDAAQEDLRERIRAAGGLGLDIALLDERERVLAAHLGDVHVDGGRVTIGRPVGRFDDHPWIEQLRIAPFAPPEPAGLAAGELREMARAGLVVESEGLYFATEAIEAMAAELRIALANSPDGLTVADIRDLLDTSRKYALALLSHFDRNGRTRRRGDYRIAGPRL